MIHNQYGLIVNQSWQWLSQQYPYIITDENIVMPNHFHGILYINREYTRTGRDLSLPTQQIKSLSEIIGSFKTRSSKLIHKAGLTEFQWQRSFYDTIIHNETQLENFRRYIRENPVRWWRDRNNI